jgi:hypothetical protein
MRKKGFNIFIILSLILHTALFGLFLLPGFSSKPKQVSTVYEVDIVAGPGMPGMSGAKQRQMASRPDNAKVRGFGEISKDSLSGEKQPLLSSPDLEDLPEQPSGERRQASEQNTLTGSDSSGSSAYGRAVRGGGAWTGVVQARFRQVWQIPEGVPINPNLQATYSIRVSRSGDIIGVKLRMSSGNKPYDRSVEMALGRVKLPPPSDDREEWIFTFVPPYGN